MDKVDFIHVFFLYGILKLLSAVYIHGYKDY